MANITAASSKYGAAATNSVTAVERANATMIRAAPRMPDDDLMTSAHHRCLVEVVTPKLVPDIASELR